MAHIIPEMTSNLLVPVAVIIYLFVLDWRMASGFSDYYSDWYPVLYGTNERVS